MFILHVYENHDFIFKKLSFGPWHLLLHPVPPVHPQTWQFNFLNVSCTYSLLSILLATNSLPELVVASRILGSYLAIFPPTLHPAARGISLQFKLYDVSPLLNLLQGLPVSSRIKTKVLALPSQSLHDLAPSCPTTLLHHHTSAALNFLQFPCGKTFPDSGPSHRLFPYLENFSLLTLFTSVWPSDLSTNVNRSQKPPISWMSSGPVFSPI